MKKIFFSNIILLLAVNLLIKPIYLFVIDAGVQNAVGPNEYGLYLAIFNLCFIFQILNDLGIQAYNTRHISQHRYDIHDYISRIMSLKLALVLVYIPVVFVVALLLGYQKIVWSLILVMCLNQVFAAFLMYLRSNLSGLGYYLTDGLISGLDKFLLIIFMIFILWGGVLDVSILTFALAQSFTLIISIVAVLLILLSKGVKVGFRFTPKFHKDLIHKSLPYALVVILMTIYSRMDGVMLERLLDDDAYQAGIYAAGFRIYDAGNIMGYLFAGLLLPIYSVLISKGESLVNLAKPAMFALWTLVCLLVFSFVFFAEDLLPIIYTNLSPDYYPPLKYLMLALLTLVLTYIYGTALTASDRLKKLNILFLIGVAINLFLNLYLIPKKGAAGAAMATLITQLIVLLGQVYLCSSIIGFRFRWSVYGKMAVFGSFSALTFYGLSIVNSIDWWICLPLGIITSIVLSFLLRLLNIGSLLSVVKSYDNK